MSEPTTNSTNNRDQTYDDFDPSNRAWQRFHIAAAEQLDIMLGDAEYHHGCGVHDADEDPGEPGGRIGEVSPIIGKVPRTPGRWHFTTGLARAAWVFVRPAPFLRIAKSRCRHQPRCLSHSPYKLITVAASGRYADLPMTAHLILHGCCHPLYLSRRTVETRHSRAFTKLGVWSRVALTLWMATDGRSGLVVTVQDVARAATAPGLQGRWGCWHDAAVTMTYGDVLDRLIDLGIAPAGRRKELTDSWIDNEVEEFDGGVFADLGVVLYVHGDDVDHVGPAYREILESAAALSGGSVVVTDVAFDFDASGDQLTFKVNGEPKSWWLDADGPDDDYLNLMAVWEQIGQLAPGGDDPRSFFHIPKDEPGDDYYLLLTAEQADALRVEFGLELDEV